MLLDEVFETVVADECSVKHKTRYLLTIKSNLRFDLQIQAAYIHVSTMVYPLVNKAISKSKYKDGIISVTR